MFLTVYLDAKYSCSSFLDIQNDLSQFENISSYKASTEVVEAQKEIKMLSMTNLLFGLLLNEYPDNYAFELTSRLLTLYGYKTNITNLIKQCDQQSPRHCALTVPYAQIQPPGNGLLYSMNKHTMPVVDLDFTNNQTAAISLSNKIIVINMQSGNTAVDLKLPKLDEPYLNSTTLPKMIIHSTKEDINNNKSDNPSDSSGDENTDEASKFKNYLFFVNSLHHVYLISTHGDIKFQQTSEKGYLTVEVINRKSGLCLLVEKNSNSVQCWLVGDNKLFSKIDLLTQIPIKIVLYSQLNPLLITIVLYDGTILFYILNKSIFIHRGTINAGKHLNLVIADKDKLICTFNSTVPIDFVHIDLQQIIQTDQILSDNDIVKTLIAFKPSISPKPIERIILPEDKQQVKDKSMIIFYMALTKESLYIVHVCSKKDISYIRILGQYDVVSIHAQHPRTVYTARGGIVNIFKWECAEGENDQCDIYHRYQLFVSIDISSSPVLTIKPASDSGKNISLLKKKTIN